MSENTRTIPHAGELNTEEQKRYDAIFQYAKGEGHDDHEAHKLATEHVLDLRVAKQDTPPSIMPKQEPLPDQSGSMHQKLGESTDSDLEFRIEMSESPYIKAGESYTEENLRKKLRYAQKGLDGHGYDKVYVELLTNGKKFSKVRVDVSKDHSGEDYLDHAIKQFKQKHGLEESIFASASSLLEG